MLKSLYFARLVTLLAIFAAPALVRGQALADRLPADTILYVGWAGVEKPAPGFKGSNLEAVLADSNLSEVFNEFLPKALDRIAHEDKDAAEGIELIRTLLGPMWRHPSAFAFAGVDINNPNGPAPRFILLSDAGREAPALKAQMEDTLKKAAQTPFAIHVFQVGDLVAAVSGYDKPQAAIPNAGANAASLATNPEFIKALAQVHKDAVLTAYVNHETLLTLANDGFMIAGGEIQKTWAAARDQLGLTGVKSAIWTAGFDKKDWRTQAFISAPRPRKGLVGSMLDGPPISKEMLAVIPKNATMAGATHFDAAAFVDVIRRAVTVFDAGAATQIDQAMEQVNAAVGLDIQKDLLATLGDEWGYYVDPAVAGNGIVGATLVNRLKNPDKAAASIEKLEKFINTLAEQQLSHQKPPIIVAFRKTTIDQTTVHYLALPLFEPAWAVADGNLYVGLYPEVVVAAAKHVSAKGESIADNPAYIELRRRLGDHPASTFEFMDLPRLVPNTYSTWIVISHLAGAGDLLGVPGPAVILPSLGKLAPRLSAAGEIIWTDADGLHLSALSPFPGSEILASDPMSMSPAQVPLMISILLPALNKARQQAQQIKSAANLKQIGLAAQIYANNQKDGAFPADFAVMLKETDLPIDVFVNPASNTVAPRELTKDQQLQWVRDQSDYVWNGAAKKSTNVGREDPLAWEKPQGLPVGVNFLFGDGHVSFELMPQAMEIIQKAQHAQRPAGGL
ncbi:MAG TPA: DUF3352 domain-containing protein [Tepidisphaeraceae bacterium]|nr:DUF3352 domain-containing protein [Tepidisphaeraceae bacterium]